MSEVACPVCVFFAETEQIIVYKDGTEKIFPADSGIYTQTLAVLEDVFNDARQMPAFGVSLDALTRKEREKGLWLELSFGGEKSCGGMPFDALLFSVRAEDCGLNLIRRVNGKYEGRCFYADLGGKTMAALYDFLKEIA